MIFDQVGLHGNAVRRIDEGRAKSRIAPRRRVSPRLVFGMTLISLALCCCSDETDTNQLIDANYCFGIFSIVDVAITQGAIPMNREVFTDAVMAYGNYMRAHGIPMLDRGGVEMKAKAGNSIAIGRGVGQEMARQGWPKMAMDGVRSCIRFLHDLPGSSGGSGRRR